MTDAELIRRAREGNSEAWNTLSRRYLPLVWRYACALLQDTHTAEDVVSEAMLAFLKSIDQIDAEVPKISAWLRSVVRHKVADHHRRAYRFKDHLPRVAQEMRNNEQQLRDSPADPSASLLVAEKKTRITEILAGLPERQRLALEWKYIEGMRVREIATRLGETEKSVEATLYRARREFRRLYELSETEAAMIPNSHSINHAPANHTASNHAPDFPWQSTIIELPKK